jgi:hypothetical protein
VKDEVVQFARAIGAVRMDLQTSLQERRLFAYPHCCQIMSGRLIIKISRIKRPFWGVNKRAIESLEKHGVYYLVLLVSDKEGGFLSSSEIKRLRLGPDTVGWSNKAQDGDYKISHPLPPLTNWFSSPESLLQKIKTLET